MEKDIESLEIIKTDNLDYTKRKRLWLSRFLTFFQFTAFILQQTKYFVTGKAMVSGWSKAMQNLICASLMIYLKWTSYDNEFNNRFHVLEYTFRRLLMFVGFIFLLYIDSQNNFESFKFD